VSLLFKIDNPQSKPMNLESPSVARFTLWATNGRSITRSMAVIEARD
jgi:hypothetical protein